MIQCSYNNEKSDSMKKFLKLIGIPFVIAVVIFLFIRFVWLRGFEFKDMTVEEYVTFYNSSKEGIIYVTEDGAVMKEEFEEVQELFSKHREPENVIAKDYPLYRKVKCGTCGRAMMFKAYEKNGKDYRYFACKHAKEQIGEEVCCAKYTLEDDLNEVVWSVVRKLLDLTENVKNKLDAQNAENQKKSLGLEDKLLLLKRKKEKCEADRFTNVDMFMAGNLDKETYQKRRTELSELIETLGAEIVALEKELQEAETAEDDEMMEVYKKMKKYSGENQLSQQMVQALIDKILVTDPEHVEIKWKFSDEIYKFIME